MNPPESRAIVEVLDAPTPRVPARIGRLDSADAIRQEMERVYRDARRRRVSSSDASRLVYMLGEIRKAYETSVIERRIGALEESTPGT